MGKNVAVFVDVANIFYAAKAAGTDIDYVTLLQATTAGRDFVRAYAYTGLDPDNENQRNFHAFLARNHYKVVSKDIRKYGDGKVKANLDIELVVDQASEPDAVSDSLIEECLRSAANKGCASVEAPQPEDPAEHKRWKRQGFVDDKPVLRKVVAPAGRRR